MRPTLSIAAVFLAASVAAAEPASPLFSRHVVGVFSRAGCNNGTCHGAVQGKNDFRLSLFGAKPEFDYQQITRHHRGRRIDLNDVDRSLILLKASARVPHGGSKVLKLESPEYQILRQWLVAGAPLDDASKSVVQTLAISPNQHSVKINDCYPLRVEAKFADGTTEDVTALCSFSSLDPMTATIDAAGQVTTKGVGDTALIARYRDEPVASQVVVARSSDAAFPEIAASNFIDTHVLAKLKRLNVPPSELADDSTFLRRIRLDITGQLPTAEEVRAFLADASTDKRAKKVDSLLQEPGYAALWTLKFCDLLNASDYGIYADGLAEHFEAPRFQAWIRARFEENTPYDEFAARILTATSREGRSLEEWSQEVIALQEGYMSPRKDLEIYAKRKTLDVYWQRRGAVGVQGTLQIAHVFLGLRLECAQCHRHPHDVWQQDDLLSFANFFMGVRKVGFEGDNEQRYPEDAKLFKQFEAEGKKLAEEVKTLKESEGKQLAEKAKAAQQELQKLKKEPNAHPAKIVELEKTIAENDALQKSISEKEKRGRLLGDDVAKRVLHAQILYLKQGDKGRTAASITSPLGSQSSKVYRLLGEKEAIEINADEDPRQRVVAWLRRPDNPFFAKAIVNRVWAHYFGRGIINPPDDLSAHNAPTHPELLDELCKQFIANKYDLKWLHRTILASRTYQQTSLASIENAGDRANYARFYLRRVSGEVLLDVLDQATGTREKLDMKYFHWPDELKAVEIPYKPQNAFVTYMLEQFGRPARNSSVQCDCARQSDASLLQVLSVANHPRVWQKIADPAGKVDAIIKQTEQPRERIEALYLNTVSRLPTDSEMETCLQHVAQSESPEKGLQSVLWGLLNTREFLLQH